MSSFVIITLDSFGITRPLAIKNLKEYLREEAKTKRGMLIDDPAGVTAKGLPLQNNFSDCGLYTIGYLKEFLRDPAKFVEKVLQKGMDAEDWTEPMNSSQMRDSLRSTIMLEHDKQHGKQPSPVKDPSQRNSPQKVRLGSNAPSSIPSTKIDDTLVEITSNAVVSAEKHEAMKSVSPKKSTRPPSPPISVIGNRGPHRSQSEEPSLSHQNNVPQLQETKKEPDIFGKLEFALEAISETLGSLQDQSQGKASTELSDVSDSSDVEMLDPPREEPIRAAGEGSNNDEDDDEDDPMPDVDVEEGIPAEDGSWLVELRNNAGQTTTMEEDF